MVPQTNPGKCITKGGLNMNSFVTTLGNELTRLFHRKKLMAGVLTAALIPLAIVLIKALALGWSTTLLYREDLFRVALSLFTPLILPLFSVVLCADAFMDEQSKGSLKTSLLLPDTRWGHFIAKIISTFIASATMMLSLWFFTLVSGLLLPSDGGWLRTLGIGLLQSVASLLPILMVIGFSVLATQLFKSGSGMVLSLVGLAFVMKISPLWLGDLNGILPATWLGFGANITYLSFASFLYALAVMILWTVFTSGLGYLRFEKKMV